VDLHHEEIAFTDEHIGRLLDGLDALGLRENTLVILTADHGEEFMERGWIGHTATLYDELVAVPLLMRLPGILPPGTVTDQVSLVDVLPTLVRDAPRRPADGTGRSLGPVLAGEHAPARDLYAEVTFWPPDTTLAIPTATNVVFKSALIAGDLKLVHDLRYERWELYDRASDPDEKRDLFGEGHAAEAGLVRRLADWEEPRRAGWLRSNDDFPTPDPKTVERLRSLGYVQ
jgi:arylsulfatase A-like enzyme